MHLLLLGATGLVGKHVLDLALADPRVTAVTAPTRRALPQRPGLFAPVVDFDNLPQEPAHWSADAVICALGTTLAVAGSREGFYRVDHDYPLEIARLARENGAKTFVLNSAMGADVRSLFFYSRVKGETERDITALGFGCTVIVRPGLIDGPRTEPRPMEQLARRVLNVVEPVLPRSLRPNRPEVIARVMLDAAITARPGLTVVPSRDLL